MNVAKEHYSEELSRLATEIASVETRIGGLSWFRGATFFPAGLCLFAGYSYRGSSTPLIYLGWLFALAFFVVITLHENFRSRLEGLQSRRTLFQRLLARINRQWKSLPSVEPAIKLEGLASSTSIDLDVFGNRSLFQWLCLAHTLLGRRRLADWLINWVPISTIMERQEAVRELVPQRDTRLNIAYFASLIEDTHANPDAFTAWATGPSWLKGHRASHIASWLGPVLFWVGLIWILIARYLESEAQLWPGAIIMVVGLVMNVVLMVGSVGSIHDIFQRINSGHGEVAGYTSLYECVAKIDGNSKLIQQLKQNCCHGPMSAIQGFSSLRNLVRMANLQRTPIFYIPYLALQLTCQWDFRAMELLELWQKKYGTMAGVWLEELGTLEALISAATLADEYPSWTYPKWTEGKEVHVEKIGHPLLSDDNRVVNDLHLEEAKQLLLITGSNMAGKSTLIRSLGLNQLIARTGAPMCALSYQGPNFELATSIRVQDSLQDGVSFFMAELHRLRDVVELARTHAATDQRPILALLDEILQGTNSRERQIAVQEVADQLVKLHVFTAISTHDLELADQPELTRKAQIVHFREFFVEENGAQKMKFDYIMRPGPTPTTNALKLLELVGLRTPLSEKS